MTSAKYPLTLKFALQAVFTGTPTIQGVGASYVYSAAHDFANDLSDLVGDAVALTSPDYTAGVLSADDPTITGLAPADVIAAFVVYNDTGTPSTSRIVRFIDTDANGVPINYTSDGSDLLVPFPGVAIVKLG